MKQAHDLEQIYVLNGHRDPGVLAKVIMAAANFSWVAWGEGKPIAVFGAVEQHKGVWQIYMLTTPDFRKIAIPLTRFLKRTMVPILFDELGCRRLEGFFHEDNVFIHRWVEGFGAKREYVKEGYAPDGKAYFGYAICKGTLDSQNQTR
ncbi:hypothetical protein [Bradyrhizobium stylosanthis]|uniref:hypothetical protein n=1 Tax=Bradyrhizobium stylosanthis TaxID=1803665 RepID=UPI0011A3E274|nr:hypothetical protein [Bradyrhizobium stylosanthis]